MHLFELHTLCMLYTDIGNNVNITEIYCRITIKMYTSKLANPDFNVPAASV